MSYAALKMIHISSVILSYLLFLLRGIWMITNTNRLQQRWIKILPHVVDTALLTSAIVLAIKLQQDPVNDSWLAVKVIFLLVYIYFGLIAFRFGKTRKIKFNAWIAAQCTFIYIVLVALTKSPVINIW